MCFESQNEVRIIYDGIAGIVLMLGSACFVLYYQNQVMLVDLIIN